MIIGDTHSNSFDDLPCEMRTYLNNVDWVFHVGDFISESVLEGFINIKGSHFIGVYGNADPLQIRKVLPAKKIVEIGGKRIGCTHPDRGGSENNAKRIVIDRFTNEKLDIILFGHTHHPLLTTINGTLFINPGKGYLEEIFFGPPTTIALLTINNKIQAEIKIIKK